MPLNSVNTNTGASNALQYINQTNNDLDITQTRINTGLKVSSAKDNGAIWAIAQNSRSSSAALNSVKDSLQRNISTVDVALSAGSQIADLLSTLKEKALAAADSSLDSTSRASLNTEFKAIRDQITKVTANASFNGTNLINTGSTAITALASADGTSRLTTAAQVLSLGGSIVTLTATASFATAAAASGLVATLQTSLTNVTGALANLGTSSKALNNTFTFIGKLQDSIDNGVGNLVDADLAKESAKLQSLQTKQQLGIQALSIANRSSSNVLSLFR